MKNQTFTTFIGFDVGSETIVAFHSITGEIKEIPNKAKAIDRYVREQNLDETCYCVCENTGGYEALLLERLYSKDIAVHRADAFKVKSFIRSFGTRAKTDALDARAIARYGQERHADLPLWEPKDKDIHMLHQLVTRREELIAAKTSETNRLKSPGAKQTPWLQKTIKPIIKALQTQIDFIDEKVEELLKGSHHLKEATKVMLTVDGIGKILAPTILAEMPELGHLTRRQAASLAGVAPHPKDSGKYHGYRRMNGGRPSVKRALFIAALTASRNENKPFGAYYKQLIQNGKTPIKAIGALMRKIIVVLNARMKDHYAQQLS